MIDGTRYESSQCVGEVSTDGPDDRSVVLVGMGMLVDFCSVSFECKHWVFRLSERMKAYISATSERCIRC